MRTSSVFVNPGRYADCSFAFGPSGLEKPFFMGAIAAAGASQRQATDAVGRFAKIDEARWGIINEPHVALKLHINRI